MALESKQNSLVLGVFIFLGLTSLGYLLGNSAIKFKEYERTVTVKGLSEKEFGADIVIWPIQFTAAGNNLEELYEAIDGNTTKISEFLAGKGVDKKKRYHLLPLQSLINLLSNTEIRLRPNFDTPRFKR